MWNGGSQLVALNYQTPSKELAINFGKFRDNGGVSIVLRERQIDTDIHTYTPTERGGGRGGGGEIDIDIHTYTNIYLYIHRESLCVNIHINSL